MSIRPEQEEQAPPVEVIERAERLLAPSHRVSNLITFEPVNISDLSKLNKLSKAAPGQPVGNSGPTAANTGNQSLRPEPRKLQTSASASAGLIDEVRSEGGRRQSLALGENMSEIAEGVDVGTGVFITYFLHAVEVERLIVINKEQLEEAVEMEEEIEVIEARLNKSEKELSYYRSELHQSKDEAEEARRDATGCRALLGQTREELTQINLEAEQLRMVGKAELETAMAKMESELLNTKAAYAQEIERLNENWHRRLAEAQWRAQVPDGNERHDQSLTSSPSYGPDQSERWNIASAELKAAAEVRLQAELQALEARFDARRISDLEDHRQQNETRLSQLLQAQARDLRQHFTEEQSRLQFDCDRRVEAASAKAAELRRAIDETYNDYQKVQDKLQQNSRQLEDKSREAESLAEQLRLLRAELSSKDKKIRQLQQIENGFQDGLDSELASPREARRGLHNKGGTSRIREDVVSSGGSIQGNNSSSKIANHRYQSLLSSSKQRERERLNNSTGFETTKSMLIDQPRSQEKNQRIKPGMSMFDKPPYTQPQLGPSLFPEQADISKLFDSGRFSQQKYSTSLSASQPLLQQNGIEQSQDPQGEASTNVGPLGQDASSATKYDAVNLDRQRFSLPISELARNNSNNDKQGPSRINKQGILEDELQTKASNPFYKEARTLTTASKDPFQDSYLQGQWKTQEPSPRGTTTANKNTGNQLHSYLQAQSHNLMQIHSQHQNLQTNATNVHGEGQPFFFPINPNSFLQSSSLTQRENLKPAVGYVNSASKETTYRLPDRSYSRLV